MVLLTTPLAVELSVWIRVVGREYPISYRMILMRTASLVLTDTVLSTASAAADMPALMIWDMFSMDSFGVGISPLFDEKIFPPISSLRLACSCSLHNCVLSISYCL